MLKVVHLQFNLTSAGKQAIRLHRAFLEAGIDSSLLSLHSDIIGDDKIHGLGNRYKFIANLDKKLQTRLTKHGIKQFGLFSYPIIGSNVAKLEQVKQADIIYIHWVQQGFLSLHSIEQLARLKKPIIVFLHDMWAITGGCHYSFDCENYKTGCNNCQMFPSGKSQNLPVKEFGKKLKLYSEYDNFYFVAPSKWMYDSARQSALTKNKPLYYIPNIADSKVYKKIDKKTAKQLLNIDEDEIVIAFGAVSVDSPYKGWKYLQSALESLHKNKTFNKVSVLIFGSNYDKQIVDAIPFKTKFMGYLKDDYSMTLVYNAADVFIAPSLAEAFGLVILESLCCGTPVVAFDVGGIPDLIKHKINGYLAKYKDAEDLANGIMFCLENNIKGSMLPVFDQDVTIKKHLELFNYIQSKN